LSSLEEDGVASWMVVRFSDAEVVVTATVDAVWLRVVFIVTGVAVAGGCKRLTLFNIYGGNGHSRRRAMARNLACGPVASG
jgi:hypothetical protein